MPARRPPDPPPPWVQCRRFRRVEELRRLLGHAHAALVAGRGAPPSGAFFHAQVDDGLAVTGGALGAPLRSEGLVAQDTLVAILVLDDGAGGGHVAGVPIADGTVILLRPGVPFAGWSPAGYRWIAFHARPPLVAAAAGPAAHGLRTLRRGGVAWSQADPEEVAWARGAVRRLGLLRPRAAREPLDAGAAAELSRHAGSVLRAALRGAVGRRAPRGLPTAGRVARAVDRLVRADGARLRLPDLCRATGVPARTLQHVFRRWFSVRPMAYVETVRLLAARRALATAADRPGAVGTVARAHGFRHLGRFSAAYRRTFGEAPRDTLRAHDRTRSARKSRADEVAPRR